MRFWKKPCTYVMLASMACQLVPQPKADAEHFFGRVARLVQEKEYSGTEPATCADGSIEILAENIDWLEHHIDTYGSIVAKQPDVWGEARLTKHRDEYERILFQELNQFEFKLNAAIRQSDQSFATAALALSDAAATTDSTTTRTPAQRFRRDAVTTVTESQTITPIVINPTDLKATLPTAPTQEFTTPYELGRYEGGGKINIEPTVYLDQLSRYVQHLNELRRINEGDDTSDSPGYAMNLVRIPVSLLPGKLTQEGFGGEITITATPVYTDDLLPSTFRNLAINDLVDQLGLTIVKFAEGKAWDTLKQIKDKNQELALDVEKKDNICERIASITEEIRKLNALATQNKKQLEIDRNSAQAEITVRTQGMSDEGKAIVVQAILDQATRHVKPSTAAPTAPSASQIASVVLDEQMQKLINNTESSTDLRHSLSNIQLATPDTSAQAATAETQVLEAYKLLSKFSEMERNNISEAIFTQKHEAETAAANAFVAERTYRKATEEAKTQSDIKQELEKKLEQLRPQIETLNTQIEKKKADISLLSGANSAPSSRGRRANTPVPPTQVVNVFGVECLAQISKDFYESYAGRNVRWAGQAECKIDGKPAECRVDLLDVRAWLQQELDAAFELMSQRERVPLWYDMARPHSGLTRAIREDGVLCSSADNCPPLAGSVPAFRDSFFQQLHIDHPASTVDRPCCKTTLECLAWAVIVESALLNDRLNEDVRRTAKLKHNYEVQPDQDLSFFLPESVNAPASSLEQFQPEYQTASQVFQNYAKSRWPIHVFAIDPANQDQNVADFSSRRRELQLALSMGFTQGAVSARTLMQYSRQLETEVETLSLNQTIVGFGHGSDTFGWRFYPRVQALDQPGAAGTVWQSFRGTPREHDVRKRQLEPGMRECVAVVLMPSFVPYADFDVRSNWFRLTNPKNAALTMKDTMKLSRAVTAMRQSRAQCAQCAHCYREGEVDRLLKRVDQLDHELPLQTMRQQIPFENTLGGFQMFSTGVTDFAPELYGWYGAPGVVVGGNYQCGCYADCQYCKATDESCKRMSVDGATIMQSSDISKKALPIPICEGSGTTLFLVGDHLSVHDTKIIAGGVCIPDVRLVSREIMRVTIPSCVNTVEVAGHKYVAVYAATPYGVTNHLHVPVVNPAKSEEEKAVAGKIKGVEQQIATLSTGVPVLVTEATLAYDASCAALGSSAVTLTPRFAPVVEMELSPAAYSPDVTSYSFAVSYRGILGAESVADLKPISTAAGARFQLSLAPTTVQLITDHLNNTTPDITTKSFDADGKDIAYLHLYANICHNNDNNCVRRVPIAGTIPIEIVLACNCCETAKATPSGAAAEAIPTPDSSGGVLPSALAPADCGCSAKTPVIEILR